MDVRLLIDGRVVWVKSHVLGRWERPLRKKKGKQIWKGRWAEWNNLLLLSLMFLFSFFQRLSALCVCGVLAVLAALVC